MAPNLRYIVNGIHLLFFLLFCSITLVNHYLFKTAALDYGLFNHAVYNFAHLQPQLVTLGLEPESVPFLASHFSLWPILFSPLWYVFGSYTLLIVQNVCIIIAGAGIYRYAIENGIKNVWLPLVHFYACWAIFTALGNDYHDNVIGACFVPWLFVFYRNKQFTYAALSLIGILVSKENMALWAIFVVVGMWLLHADKRKPNSQFALLAFIFSIIYFLLITGVVMPALSPSGKFDQMRRFSHLGGSIFSVGSYILLHPIETLKLMWVSHVRPDEYEVLKQEFLIALLISGGFAFIIRPAYLIMIIPLLFQKLLNKEIAFWGIDAHYAIEFAPLATMAIIDFSAALKIENLKKVALVCCTIAGITTTAYLLYNRALPWYNSMEKENPFSKAHYQTEIDTREVLMNLKKIDTDLAVSAHVQIAAHLANRKSIYHFPLHLDKSDVVVLFRNPSNTYPIDQERYIELRDSLLNEPSIENTSTYKELLVLRKK
jgi:uncharacterized membrane protein